MVWGVIDSYMRSRESTVIVDLYVPQLQKENKALHYNLDLSAKQFQSLKESKGNYRRYFPDDLLSGYDPTFSIQKFFVDKDCFLKEIRVNGQTIAYCMERACQQYNISQRFFIAHLVYEQSIFVVQLKKGKVYYPSGQVKTLKHFLDTLCGVSGGRISTFPKYYGVKKQIDLCCKIYRREMDFWQSGMKRRVHRDHLQPWSWTIPKSASAWALFVYTPYFSIIDDHYKIYKMYFPEQIKRYK